MQKPTDEKLLQAAVDALARYGSKKAAADSLGWAENTIYGRLKEAERRNIRSKVKADPVQAMARRDEIKRLRGELDAIVRENLTAEKVRKTILDLKEVTPSPPEWLPPKKTAKHGVTGVPSVIWSDWHLGEVVRRQEVNGVNEFNLTIAEERIRRLVDRTVDLCFKHMTSPRYPGIVVNLIGDIVSGEIHPELTQTNEVPLFQVLLWARDRIVAALKRLADRFGFVFVPSCPGNHGRMTHKPQAKQYVYRNADWLLACLVERYFVESGDKRVQFHIPDTGEALYRVYDHRYLAVHGDDLGVKGGDGIIGAIGPIMRGEIKMRHSQAQIDRDYDTILMGHWHQTLWLPRAHVNNTLKGYDEYARRFLRAPATPPAQSLWFTHPTRGITARWEVVLSDAPVASGAEWVSWEKAA